MIKMNNKILNTERRQITRALLGMPETDRNRQKQNPQYTRKMMRSTMILDLLLCVGCFIASVYEIIQGDLKTGGLLLLISLNFINECGAEDRIAELEEDVNRLRAEIKS